MFNIYCDFYFTRNYFYISKEIQILYLSLTNILKPFKPLLLFIIYKSYLQAVIIDIIFLVPVNIELMLISSNKCLQNNKKENFAPTRIHVQYDRNVNNYSRIYERFTASNLNVVSRTLYNEALYCYIHTYLMLVLFKSFNTRFHTYTSL